MCPLKAAVLFSICFCKPLPVETAIKIIAIPIATANMAILIIRAETLPLFSLLVRIRREINKGKFKLNLFYERLFQKYIFIFSFL